MGARALPALSRFFLRPSPRCFSYNYFAPPVHSLTFSPQVIKTLIKCMYKTHNSSRVYPVPTRTVCTYCRVYIVSSKRPVSSSGFLSPTRSCIRGTCFLARRRHLWRQDTQSQSHSNALQERGADTRKGIQSHGV